MKCLKQPALFEKTPYSYSPQKREVVVGQTCYPGHSNSREHVLSRKKPTPLRAHKRGCWGEDIAYLKWGLRFKRETGDSKSYIGVEGPLEIWTKAQD